MVHLTAMQKSGFESGYSIADGKLCQSSPYVGCHLEWHITVGWPLRGTEKQEYTKIPQNIKEKKLFRKLLMSSL